jgi:predicted acetyltransferase
LHEPLRCRFARTDEIADLARLTAHSFPGAQRPPEWWAEQLGRPRYGGGADTLFIGESAGRPVAALQLHPLTQWIAGQPLPCAGIGSVAISPAQRRRGFGAELVAAALRAAVERGDIVSALYPFRSDFYNRLGYGQAGEALQYQVGPESLPDAPERQRVELLESETDRAAALALYNGWIQAQTGQLERGARVWAHLCSAPDRALVGYRAENGALEGYALVVYRTDLPPQARFLEVDELVWTSAPARRGLYAWLASLGDQWQQILIRALPSQRLGDWLREPRLPHGAAPNWGLWAPGATLLMGPMFRLLDVRAAWERRSVAAESSLVVAFQLADAQIPENGGRWRCTLRDGAVAIDRHGGAELTIHLDVATLSRIHIGALPATAALEAGLLECDRPDRLAALDSALALPQPWTFDRF